MLAAMQRQFIQRKEMKLRKSDRICGILTWARRTCPIATPTSRVPVALRTNRPRSLWNHRENSQPCLRQKKQSVGGAPSEPHSQRIHFIWPGCYFPGRPYLQGCLIWPDLGFTRSKKALSQGLSVRNNYKHLSKFMAHWSSGWRLGHGLTKSLKKKSWGADHL